MELLLVRGLPMEHEQLRPVLTICVNNGVGCIIARRPDGVVIAMTSGPHEVEHVADDSFGVWDETELLEVTNAVGAAAYLLADHYRKEPT